MNPFLYQLVCAVGGFALFVSVRLAGRFAMNSVRRAIPSRRTRKRR